MIYYDSSTEFKSLTLNIFQLISIWLVGTIHSLILTAVPTGVSILKNSTVIWKFQLEKLEELDMIYLLIFNFSASGRYFADDNRNVQQFFNNSSDWISALIRKRSYMYTRRLMGSTDQADPSCIYFRISWILMEWPWFYFFFVPSTCCRASEVQT